MSTPVLVAVPGPAEAGLVAAWAGPRSDVLVARRCADLPEVLAAAQAGLGRAALVGADFPGADAESVDLLARCGVALVVLLPAGAASEPAERHWRRLGALRFATVTDAPDAVARALLTAVDSLGQGAVPQPVPLSAGPGTSTGVLGPPPTGRSVAVWGPAGSSGRTTVAVNLAAELAATGATVLLVDADTRGAAVGQALGVLDEAPGLLAAVRAATEGRLDASTLRSCAPEVVTDLLVLTGSPDPSRWRELRPVGLRRVLEVAGACADWVVVDLPGGLDDTEEGGRDVAARAVLDAVDAVLVVGAADPVGLQRWVRAWQRRGEDLPGAHVVPVLNRVRASAVGAPAARRVADTARRFAGVEDPVLVPDDAAVEAALLAGRTLLELAPRSPARRAVQVLAVELETAALGADDLIGVAATDGFDPLLASS